jgi:hypothetical protein
MAKFTEGKLTVGEVPIHNNPYEREIDCHMFGGEPGKCPYGQIGGEACHHLGQVPQSFDLQEINGCAGTHGRPWKQISKGSFTTYKGTVEFR